MNSTITVSVTPRLRSRLNRLSKRENVNKSEIVRDALKQYIARQEFRELRQKMLPEAENRGIYTDEDVFKQLS